MKRKQDEDDIQRDPPEADLMSRTLFSVDGEGWEDFTDALDRENPDNQAGLEKLKSAPLPWR